MRVNFKNGIMWIFKVNWKTERDFGAMQVIILK
jgi:hypothetical protein